MGRRKTPQEKKKLSYDRDRRNVYSENDKASRKNIPLSKQRAAQAYRTKTKQVLDAVSNGADPDEAESQVRGVRARGEGISTAWRKQPDAPLRSWLKSRTNR